MRFFIASTLIGIVAIFGGASFFSRQTVRLTSIVAQLAAPEGRNYYHFLFDMLPRFKTLEAWKHVIDSYAVPNHLSPAQLEALSLLGAHASNLLQLEPNSHFRVESLVVPSLPGSEGCYPPWSLDFLRGEVRSLAFGVDGRGERLFVSRGRNANRPLRNESEIEAIAQKHGFAIVRLEELSFLEQIAAFRDARCVVGAHGAGFANIVFSDGLSLLEVFSEDYIRPDCFFTLCCRLGFKYDYEIAFRPEFGSWGEGVADLARFELKITRLVGRQE